MVVLALSGAVYWLVYAAIIYVAYRWKQRVRRPATEAHAAAPVATSTLNPGVIEN